jgi:hypothetical protein
MRFLWRNPLVCVAFLCVEVDIQTPVSAGRPAMYDAIYLLLGIGGFVVCLAYVHLCDRL